MAKAVQLDEAERRLRDLADRLETCEDRMLTRHTETMRAILTAMSMVVVGAVLAVSILGYYSKSEVSEEVRDMPQAVNYETQRSEIRFDKMRADFQQQFNAFAGDALKRPMVEISISSGPLNNQILHLTPGQGRLYPLYPLFIKNVGQKRTDPLSFYLYSSVQFLGNNISGLWEADASSDRAFPFKYRSQNLRGTSVSKVELAPGESWSILGDYDDSQFFNWAAPTNAAWCKFVVFYGGENPAEARFQLKYGP